MFPCASELSFAALQLRCKTIAVLALQGQMLWIGIARAGQQKETLPLSTAGLFILFGGPDGRLASKNFSRMRRLIGLMIFLQATLSVFFLVFESVHVA